MKKKLSVIFVLYFLFLLFLSSVGLANSSLPPYPPTDSLRTDGAVVADRDVTISWECTGDPDGNPGCDHRNNANYMSAWRDYVICCLNTLIDHGTDVYGSVHTPMLMAIIDSRTLTSPEDPLKGFCPGYCEDDLDNPVFYDACVRTEGRPCHGRLSPGGSNVWLDQPTLKAMYRCTKMTGDSKYAEAADAYLTYFLANCKKKNNMFVWGSHIYWDCYNDRPGGDGGGTGPHEILIKHPVWEAMYRLNPGAVRDEIDGIWDLHICDKATGQHNRHDDGACGCDFAFSGGSFAIAFSFMYSVTGETHYLDKAKLVANWHWQHRNPITGLVADAPGIGDSRYDGCHCMTSVTGPFASQLLRCYELTGDTDFRDQAIAYIKAYEKYGWDDEARTYWGMLKLDGTPVKEQQGSGYGRWAPYGHIDLWRTTMYSYEFPLIAAQSAIYAYEQSDNDPELLAVALHWAEVIEDNLPPYTGRRWKKELEAAMPEVLNTGGTYAENYGRAISFFVHLYRATDGEKYLQLAEGLAKEAVEKLYKNGLFVGHPAKPYYQANDGVGFLLYALLELDDPSQLMAGAF